MVIADYFKTIEQLLSYSKLIMDKAVEFKEFSSDEGMVRGRLLFLGGYVLTFMEEYATQEKAEFVAAQDFCDWLRISETKRREVQCCKAWCRVPVSAATARNCK